MRQSLAVLVILFFIILPTAPMAEPSGKDVFLKYKCDNCHAVSTADIASKGIIKTIKAPDLADVTVRHELLWIRRYIRQNDVHVSCPEVDKSRDGKKMMVRFSGTQNEEDELVEWLDQQRRKK